MNPFGWEEEYTLGVVGGNPIYVEGKLGAKMALGQKISRGNAEDKWGLVR